MERAGLNPNLSFKIPDKLNISKSRPKLAILREQGVNGHTEMAAAFHGDISLNQQKKIS